MMTATQEYRISILTIERYVRRATYVFIALALGTAAALFARSAGASLATSSARVTSFGPIESHLGRVRGEVVDVAEIGGAERWVVRLQTAAGLPIDNDLLRVRAFMPESGQLMQPEPSVSAISGGRYEITGLRFASAGWWSVALAIENGARGDSLAFNLVVQ